MCEPMTIAAIGAAGVGTFMQASAASARGAAAKSVAERNALMAQRQAADAISRSLITQGRVRMRGTQVIGVQQSQYAASGVIVGMGSPAEVTQETRVLSDLEEEIVRNNAAREAYGYRTGAARSFQEGAYAEAQARDEVLGSVIGGVGRVAQIGAGSWLDAPGGAGPSVPNVEPSYGP